MKTPTWRRKHHTKPRRIGDRKQRSRLRSLVARLDVEAEGSMPAESSHLDSQRGGWRE